MAIPLTNEEKETIITFDETPADAIVFTYSKSWQKHIEQRLGIKPHMINGYGGREYKVPKKRIRPPLPPRNLTPEQRKKIGERLAKGLRKKSPNLTPQTSAKGKGERVNRKRV